MLNLDPRIYFDKIVLPMTIQKELNCPGIAVAYGAPDFDSISADRLPLLFCYCKCRGKLYYLLVPSLYGTVSFIKVDQVSKLVPEYLYLYVLWLLKVFLNKYIVISESFLSLISCTPVFTGKLLLIVYDSHPSASAPC